MESGIKLNFIYARLDPPLLQSWRAVTEKENKPTDPHSLPAFREAMEIMQLGVTRQVVPRTLHGREDTIEIVTKRPASEVIGALAGMQGILAASPR